MHTLYIVTIGCTYTFNVSRSRKDHLTSFQNRSPTVTMLEFVPASGPPRACIMYDLLQGITEPYSHFGAFSGSASAASDWMAGPGVVYIFTAYGIRRSVGAGSQYRSYFPSNYPLLRNPLISLHYLPRFPYPRRYTMHQHDLPLTPYGFIEMYVLLPHFCQSWLDGAVTQNWAATSLCY